MRGCNRDTPTPRTMNPHCVIAPHASPADAGVRHLGELAENPGTTLWALRRSLPLSQGELSIVNELIACVMSALL
jgi:hypothetical protein